MVSLQDWSDGWDVLIGITDRHAPITSRIPPPKGAPADGRSLGMAVEEIGGLTVMPPPGDQGLKWRKLNAVNREVTETLVQVLTDASPSDDCGSVLAAVQTGGIDLGMQLCGTPLMKALGKHFPSRTSIRSSLLLLGWHQILPIRHTDMESHQALQQGLVDYDGLPLVVDDPDRRSKEIDNYVICTGADRTLIEEATTLYLRLVRQSDESWGLGDYCNWRYRAVRGMLRDDPRWRDERDVVEIMVGATHSAALFRDLHAYFAELINRPGSLVASSVDASVLFQSWFDFVAVRGSVGTEVR